MATPTKVLKDGKPIKDREGRTKWRIAYRVDGAWTSGTVFAHHLQHAYAEIDRREAGVGVKDGHDTEGGMSWLKGLSEWLHANEDSHSDSYRDQVGHNVKLFAEANGNCAISRTTREQLRSFFDSRSVVSGATGNRSKRIIAMAIWLKKHHGIDFAFRVDDFPTYDEIPVRQRQEIDLDELHKYINAIEAVTPPEAGKKHYIGHPGKFQSAGKHIIQFLLLSGVRSSEACGLKETDFKNGELNFIQKDNRPRRIIVNKHIEECINSSIAEKRANNINHEFVFFNTAGKPWNRGSLLHHWNLRLRLAKLPKCTIHELRHTFCTVAGSQNFSEKMIQSASGHSSVEALRRYMHSTISMQEQVTSSVDDVLAAKFYQEKQ